MVARALSILSSFLEFFTFDPSPSVSVVDWTQMRWSMVVMVWNAWRASVLSFCRRSFLGLPITGSFMVVLELGKVESSGLKFDSAV
jgi:hypothetical protein